MAKKHESASQGAFSSDSYLSSLKPPQDWQSQIAAATVRFNQEYRGEPFDLPEEVEAMPIFRERASGTLQTKLASPFWEVAQPKKNHHCLDIGCGVSFLIYPWREWDAVFYGQEISDVARDI